MRVFNDSVNKGRKIKFFLHHLKIERCEIYRRSRSIIELKFFKKMLIVQIIFGFSSNLLDAIAC
jgi:hypothetical protein